MQAARRKSRDARLHPSGAFPSPSLHTIHAERLYTALYGQGGQQGLCKARFVIFVASDLAALIQELKTGRSEETSTKTDLGGIKW